MKNGKLQYLSKILSFPERGKGKIIVSLRVLQDTRQHPQC
jgi:hypothetical protein